MAHDPAVGGRALLPDILSWVDVRMGHNEGALEFLALHGTLAGSVTDTNAIRVHI
jgi:hypothetical protein